MAVGATHYEFGCGQSAPCTTNRFSTYRIAGGYRFGVFGLEGYCADYGPVAVDDGVAPGTLSASSLGFNAVWLIPITSLVQGLVRVGPTQSQRSRRGQYHGWIISVRGGLGLVFDLTPTLAVEIAGNDTVTHMNSGSPQQSWMAGLRVRF